MSTIQNVLIPVPTRAPRGARWFGQLLSALLPARKVDAATARQREAEEVRQMARELRGSDPGFAADLLAAADRHATGN